MRLEKTSGGQHLLRPAPRADVQPKRAGGIRHIGNCLAGHAKPEPILWQQNAPDECKQVRFVFADPKQLRRGEPGHGEIAGDGTRAGFHRFQGNALSVGATVVPQNRWSQHTVSGIEQNRAVHLARDADPADLQEIMVRSKLSYRSECRMPPVFGILFGP
jgi:hypothetical protein